MHLLLPASVLALLAAAAPAQSCATLNVSGTGLPGTDLVFSYQGAPHAYGFLIIGDTQGTTTIRYGSLGTLTLDLDFPFLPLLIGRTDSNGDRTRTVHVPSSAPPLDLFAQGFDFYYELFPLRLEFCTSNVLPVHIGL
jgi:hypothetical protein